ncbi:Mss4-like protein [Hypoxylon trugodes]|uniref:Mss4-like protein n=1 Tax=Hypoxylon trugodes TaxID=326681 RepID=UPI00219315ED|nr:Mss4-like protein [Hypoxylon trugodes]KAI1387254.1 Mss4-like protein [Hypoxylon trugodes]
MPAAADKTKTYIPLSGVAKDGWSTDTEATATCFCGAVQLSFPTQAPGLVDSFVCNCHDCRKVTASMFASNFIIDNEYLTHVRGQDNLKSWGQDVTPASGNKMTNYFCNTCGTLMYRVSSGAANQSYLRIGTVDDFNLHETKLRPRTEQFIEGRVNWFHGVDGARHVEGSAYGKAKE